MIWLDMAMKTAAVVSAVIATLRAGSRAVYLLDHDGIGIMDGPVIQNTNETYPLFELSEAFRHCVRLSIAPDHYENVQTRKPVTSVVEPYPLSTRPYLPRIEIERETKTAMEDHPKVVMESVEQEATFLVPKLQSLDIKTTFWRRQYDATSRTLSSVSSSIKYTGKYLSMTPQILSYWTTRAWNWRQRKQQLQEEQQSDSEDDDGKSSRKMKCFEKNEMYKVSSTYISCNHRIGLQLVNRRRTLFQCYNDIQ